MTLTQCWPKSRKAHPTPVGVSPGLNLVPMLVTHLAKHTPPRWGFLLTRVTALQKVPQLANTSPLRWGFLRDSTSLSTLTQDLALALVEAQEAEQEEQPNLGPADGLFYTLDQVKAHAAAAASMADVDAIFPVGGMDDD